MLEFLKESFLSIFVVSYRINKGAWPASFNADAHKGVAAIAIVVLLLAFTVFGWLQVLLNTQVELSPIVIVITTFVLYGGSYHLLLTRKVGIDFEKKFDRFPKTRRIALRAAAIVIFFGTFAILFFSGPYYQRAFHILPKT